MGNDNAKELKPCPFCGGKAVFRVKTEGCKGEFRIIGFGIECRECGIEFPKRYEIYISLGESGELQTCNHDDRKQAIEDWNTRGCKDDIQE